MLGYFFEERIAHANELFYSFLTYGRMHAYCLPMDFFILSFLCGQHAEIARRLHREIAALDFPLCYAAPTLREHMLRTYICIGIEI
jgi:hypothetical protein